MIRIPFNRASFLGNERRYIEESLTNLHISSDGSFSKRASAILAEELVVPRALLTTSCTDALEMCGLLLDLAPGDEVIMPSFTFVSTANAFALRGAKPVFVDIRGDTYNLDERLLEAAITPRTKAICVVHYAGIACEMDTIMAIAARRGIPVIEDNAHGLFGRYKGRPLGGFGELSTLSFHETKNLSCGEGGALACRDPRFVERAEILHAKGTNRARFLRGQVDKYTWCDVGSSFGMSDLLAAVLFGQLEARNQIMNARQRLYEWYRDALGPTARNHGWQLQHVPEHCESAYHMFSLLMRSQAERDELITYLRANGVLAVFHYVPLHTSDMGKHFGYEPGQFPVTEDVSARLVRLPFFNSMSDQDADDVIKAVRAFADRH
ncbi:MAG TPA: dTDP-4-amino-4,6-dideoxygalactose transaminase [Polyangiales bacterium]|nr:dTDP-4-amino-4,6-dideoxygalactose transaminase [Polyangiales bacterium]